eukprot:scaffold11.g3925.t1
MASVTVEVDKRAAGYGRLREEPPPMPTGEVPPTTEEWQQRRLWGAGIMLTKAILGVAVLALPRIFSLIGVGTGTHHMRCSACWPHVARVIWLAFIALLTHLSLALLTKASARTGLLTLSDVVITDLSLCVLAFGFATVYLVVVGDALVGNNGMDGLLSEACGNRRTVLAVVCLLLLLPLSVPRTPRALTSAALLGIAAILLWAAITLLHRVRWWPVSVFVGHGWESAVQMVGVLPILLISFSCQNTFQHTLRDVAVLDERQVSRTAGLALALAAGAYLLISVCSVALFGKAEIEANVLNNFTVEALEPFLPPWLASGGFMAVKLAFVISLVASFPLQIGPLRDSLWRLLFRQELIASPGYFLVSAALVIGAYFAAAWVTSIWVPLLILGSTAGAIIAFIIPGALGVAMDQELSESAGAARARQMGGAALVAVGLVVGVGGIIRLAFYRDPLAASS